MAARSAPAETHAGAPTTARQRHVPAKTVALIGGIAAPVALLGNLLLYVVANAAGWFDPVTRPYGRPITEVEVIVATLMAVLAALGAYVALARLTRYPARNFTFIAAAVFAVSVFPPATLDRAPGELVAVLVGMHALTAGLCIAAVWLFGRPEKLRG